MMQSLWQHIGREPELACDVAVVGAGAVGCSTAYWISRLDPECRIALVDARSIAGGASGKSAGFLLQGALSDILKDRAAFGSERARALWRFTRENRDLIFSELDGSAFELESSGSVSAAGSEEEDRRLKECVAVMRSMGAPTTYLRPKETNKRLRSAGFLGGLYVPSGGMLNPVSFARHLAERSGALICEHAPVMSVEMRSSGAAIETERRVVRADRAVLALNAWLPRLFPSLSRYVRPVRGQMYAAHDARRRWLNLPVYSHDGYYYARQTKTGAFLVGGARHRHEDVEVGYDEVVTDAVQADIEEYVRTHFPRAASLKIKGRWSGTMGFSPDHVPIIGDVPGVPGSVWAGGFSGHGLAYSFRFGKLLAEIVLDRYEAAGLDLFSADRFIDATESRASAIR